MIKEKKSMVRMKVKVSNSLQQEIQKRMKMISLKRRKRPI
jgi:hypothetical protein